MSGTIGSALRFARAPREVALARLRPELLFRRYGELARRAGLDRLHLVLSFDCDTLEDAEVAVEVHERLLALGVTAAYAVPGEILERGADAYRAIAATGAEFLNHGFLEHTVKEDGAYRSTLFYDRLSAAELERDVRRGGEAVEAVVGRRPSGFRVPHFGTFQRPAQLRGLHALLAREGYAYSSSTLPLWGFRHGPMFRELGVVEFPVSGTATWPLRILDSWGFFAAPDRDADADAYRREARAVARLYEQAEAGILSFYADPSQVHGEAAFFDAVKAWREIAEPATYAALASRTSSSIAAPTSVTS